MAKKKPFEWPKRDPNIKPTVFPNFRRDYKLMCELTPEEKEYALAAYQEAKAKYTPLEGTTDVFLIDFFPENADWLAILRSERERLAKEAEAKEAAEATKH